MSEKFDASGSATLSVWFLLGFRVQEQMVLGSRVLSKDQKNSELKSVQDEMKKALLLLELDTSAEIGNPITTWGREKDDYNGSLRYLAQVLAIVPPLNHRIWVKAAFDILAGKLGTLSSSSLAEKKIVSACAEFIDIVRETETAGPKGDFFNNFVWQDNSCFIDVALLLMCSLLVNPTDILRRVVSSAAFTTKEDPEAKLYKWALLISGCHYIIDRGKKIKIGNAARKILDPETYPPSEYEEGDPVEYIESMLNRFQLIADPMATYHRRMDEAQKTTKPDEPIIVPNPTKVEKGDVSVVDLTASNVVSDRRFEFDLTKIIDPFNDFSAISTNMTYFVDIGLKQLNDLDVTHLIGQDHTFPESQFVYIVTGAAVYSENFDILTKSPHYLYVQWTSQFEGIRLWDSVHQEKGNISSLPSWSLATYGRTNDKKFWYTILRYEAVEKKKFTDTAKWLNSQSNLTLNTLETLSFRDYGYLKSRSYGSESKIAYKLSFIDTVGIEVSKLFQAHTKFEDPTAIYVYKSMDIPTAGPTSKLNVCICGDVSLDKTRLINQTIVIPKSQLMDKKPIIEYILEAHATPNGPAYTAISGILVMLANSVKFK